MGKARKDLMGMRFERLTVIGTAEPIMNKRGEKLTRWLCRCDCGTIKVIRASELIGNRTLSCGCLGKERRKAAITKHGISNTRVYHAYLGMLNRCFDNTNDNYKSYGGRGITVCDEWKGENGAENFYKWAMNNGYEDNLTLDRINVNGSYEPDNCRWVSMLVQNNNKRDNVFITHNGETRTMKEWSRITGIGYTTIKERIRRGWDSEIAITKPVDARFSH